MTIPGNEYFTSLPNLSNVVVSFFFFISKLQLVLHTHPVDLEPTTLPFTLLLIVVTSEVCKTRTTAV